MTALEILDVLKEAGTQYGWIILIVLTLVEVTPIKLNPWSKLLNYIGNAANGELNKKMDSMQCEITNVKREFEIKNASDMRWDILDFANSCRNGRKHGREEWVHVVDQLKEYETYVKEHKISNGVLEEETKYLRELYRERCLKNDFI